MPPKLPNELVDAIISSVSESSRWVSTEDKQTLLSCTLVSRDWLPASRHLLFSEVVLTRPTVWDSFVRWVVDAERGRPWLASIHHLTFKDKWYYSRSRGKDIPAEPISGWRGQYVVPVLAGRLPNLESLSLCVDWAQCEPHPSTFGMFAQFPSLRELSLSSCHFPSFSAFRRVLVSLPALKDLICMEVHWKSAPQPSILAVQTRQPTLEGLRISLSCRCCTLAFLEWLTHTPTRSSLVELDLHPGWPIPSQHQISLSGRNLNYYAKLFGPSLRRATLNQAEIRDDVAARISLSSFPKLNFLSLQVDSRDWSGVADMLQLLPARLVSLFINLSPQWPVTDGDRLIREDGELKAMRTGGLELLDPVLSRDNFKDLRVLAFSLLGYRDTLPSYRESTLASIQQKLPMLHGRATLDIQLELILFDRSPPPSPVVEGGESVQLAA